MYELQSTLSTYAKRKYSSGEISVEHLKNILKVRKKHATVALIYLSLKWWPRQSCLSCFTRAVFSAA